MSLNILNSKLNMIKLNKRLSKIKEKTGMIIQSILFPKNKFNLTSAKKWAKQNGYKSDQVFIAKNILSLRQKQPGRFASFKTIKLDDGVMARIAGNIQSRFAGSIVLKNISKFSDLNIKSDLDIKIPMQAEVWILSEGANRDGDIARDDLEESLERWSNLAIIDFHDKSDEATIFKPSDQKGILNNPRLSFRDGKQWIVNDAIITDRSLAYIMYVRQKSGDPLEVSAEFKSTPFFRGTDKFQTNILPELISIVDKGHIEGNKIRITSEA